MRKKLSIFLVLFIAFFGVTLILLKSYATPESTVADSSYTFFAYETNKIDGLCDLTSSHTITEDALRAEDEFVEKYLISKKAPFFDKMRVYTYLYAGQREMAFLSYATKNHFEGNIHLLTERILKLFYPNFITSKKPVDAYSQKLTDIVFYRLKKRYEQEQKLSNNYATDQWIPWIAKPSIQFFPSPYNREYLNAQINEILATQQNATPLEKQKALNWEEGRGADSGDWISITNHYLFDSEKNIPLGKIILIRNLLSITLYDTEIAVYEAKYHFLIKRPFEINSSVQLLGPMTTSPSYPSGHAALAGGASALLSHFFPDDKKAFSHLREQATFSRLIAGVHTPIDISEGKKMGEKIAFEVLLNEWGLKEKEAITNKNVDVETHIRHVGGKYLQRPKCCSRRAFWQHLMK